jgi:carbon-monoxide dehydrogenase small subunit
MLIACQDLINRIPNPNEEEVREAISGNLCRCTGYQQIVDAVLHATSLETKHHD